MIRRLAKETDRFISIITQSERGSRIICSMKQRRSRVWFILEPVCHCKMLLVTVNAHATG